MSELNKCTILDSWPMIRDDFEELRKDPYCWFINELEKARVSEEWEAVDKLIDIFNVLHASDNHE